MKFSLALLLVLVLPLPGLAIDYQANCSIAFQGSSTLHDFHGTGRCQPFIVNEDSGLLTIPAVTVGVAGLDTGNAKRDKQMRAMFEADRFPLITGRAGQVSIKELLQTVPAGSEHASGMRIMLKIRAIETEVPVEIRNFVETETGLAADLNFSLSLDDYQLEPPSVLGIIRVGDRIDVTASFVLDSR